MLEEASKICFKCGELKPLSLFYKHPQMADGHVNKCKECNKKDVIDNTRKNSEYYLEYDRQRYKTDKRKRDYKKFMEVTKIRHGWKKKANTAVSSAVKTGVLIKPNHCEYCGSGLHIEAHHSSYSNDMHLVVTWLCRKCHGHVHRKCTL